jgi:hypothetical protein
MKSHVPTYHTWMSDPDLLRLTASEPLSLDEELLNQQSWLLDPAKLTFIVADRDDPSLLLGDVNLYLHPHFDPGHAEIAVMIANPSRAAPAALANRFASSCITPPRISVFNFSSPNRPRQPSVAFLVPKARLHCRRRRSRQSGAARRTERLWRSRTSPRSNLCR